MKKLWQHLFTAYQNATEINLTPNFGKTDSEAFTGSAYKGKSLYLQQELQEIFHLN